MKILCQKRPSLLFAFTLALSFLLSMAMSSPRLHQEGVKTAALMQAGIKQFNRPILGPITPHNTLFVFDIDDVLLLIKKSKKAKFGLYLLIRPDVWGDFVKIKHHSGYSETMIKTNKKLGIVKRLKRMKYGKTPIEGIIEILQALKQKGYTLHIASNMTKADFEFYQNQYPGIFSLFDAAFVIENKNMPQKPSKKYFDLYRATYPTTKRHFFIDDKQKNCDASGFAYTHVFKNAQQLRLDLTARGVL